ncbi:MAG TPA: diguanylate cyclase [Pyrinomonadaceae bacterium]|jgi:diguanylate cyclase (GGDEF)-like protein|nr:diguanylate cyclase [Pyrinomonadaceae bacterium]
MDQRDVRQRDTVQPQAQTAPEGWAETQDSLAAASGLSILLVNGPQPPALAVSNNNSICQAFQSSPTHARLCDPFCGQAHERALKAGAATHYRCHAGLHCFTMPVQISKAKKKLAVIGGRAFLTSADYRQLAERFRVGDLQELLTSDLFKNVIFASRQDLDDLAARVAEAAARFKTGKSDTDPPTAPENDKEAITAEPVIVQDKKTPLQVTTVVSDGPPDAPGTAQARVGLFHSRYFQPGGAFSEACSTALDSLAQKYQIPSLALLMRDRNTLVFACGKGRFESQPPHIEIGLKDARLGLVAKARTSLTLSEEAEGYKPAATRPSQIEAAKNAELFPLVVGDEVKAALLIAGTNLTDEKRTAISNYCRDIALPLEVLRLRTELEQRTMFADYLQSYTERIYALEPADTYHSILRHSAELLHAERGSLLLYDEASNELAVKAALGLNADARSQTRIRLGDGVSGGVMLAGRPLVVRDLETSGHTPAPAECCYKTKSFISFPISIGGRKVGVLNVTDKAGGGSYDEIDLDLLETIAPQMALALDRAEWHEKAEQFQLISITDPLTGLLNRRYLEERLTEELKRSKRQGYAMSFMMIDIDDFKLYNDRNGHQAGDLALEMTAQCLKSALRAADVAARYGGEEFCILLPQTGLTEAASIAERIKRRIERTRFPHGKQQPLGAVTVSIGVSAFSPDAETPEAIIGLADRALYLAKHQGKNRVRTTADAQPKTRNGNAAHNSI